MSARNDFKYSKYYRIEDHMLNNHPALVRDAEIGQALLTIRLMERAIFDRIDEIESGDDD